MLKHSERNCILAFSPTGKLLYRAQFQVFSPGPRIIPVPQSPKNPNAGAAKALVLNHCDKLFRPETVPTQLGRVASPPVPVDIVGANAKPLSITVRPEKVHCQSIFPTQSPRVFMKGRSYL